MDKTDEVKVSQDLKDLGFRVEREIGMGKREKVAAERGRVLAIGPMCWKAPQYGYGLPEWEPWCKVGDIIIFAKYSGKLLEEPGQDDVFLLNDDDVQLVVLEDEDD